MTKKVTALPYDNGQRTSIWAGSKYRSWAGSNSGKQRQTAADKITINKWQPTVADSDKLRPDNITINNGWWLAVADSDKLRQTRLPSEQMVANSG